MGRPPAEQRFLAFLSSHPRRASLIGDLLDQTRVTAGLYRGALDSLAVSVILTIAELFRATNEGGKLPTCELTFGG